ncbi:MAG: superoxide dismutase [Prevotellaceae bacterium]|jgi:Fe-Mn family superoxide dismutase|nr:superoxide dismutase [Prevotellaceae bacterium]
MKFELPKLSYAVEALAPAIGKETVEFHYGKHFLTYINNLNGLVQGTKFENADLETIVRESDGAIFNNAGQVLNHDIYFKSFSQSPKSEPSGKLLEAIQKRFGSFGEFKEEFGKASVSLFGSGWAWLYKKDDGSLAISQEQNAGNPIHSKTGFPLICCDVWEHSYYLDYQNRRADYVKNYWNILDWKIVENRYATDEL